MFERSLTVASALLLCMALPALAQDWRTVTTTRQFAGEDALRVDVEYGAGQLRVRPGAAGTLYSASVRYDADLFEPTTNYRSGRLELDLEGRGRVNPRIDDPGRLELTLGPDAPLDLEMSFGAVEADLELGGIRLERGSFQTGASETRLAFSSPNPIRARMIQLKLGAAEARVIGLGNANAERISVNTGVGEVLLDFTGEWRGDTEADVRLGIGAVTIRLPRTLGVRIERDTFLATFEAPDFDRRGDAYESANWSDARHRLTLRVSAALSSVNIEWVD